ncbi:MAG TPA: 2-amino-4-hydroxy-6-hydroxymethyldihydropteridine diphosphokinase [Pirellulales bacterium]|nr:2-amino-4-hydroxy-6-hydroxymethyldihydropteridine diphosphokinase [Pirellulales bacterium]
MPRSLVALGSNLGDRRQWLDRAIALLAAEPRIESFVASRYHSTTPVGGPGGQESFLNAAVRFETSLAPEQLHAVLRRIEDQLGRARGARWGPRTIDLDLLLYGDALIDTLELIVPHPRMAFRRFALEPAADVAPEMVHPTIGWTIARMLEHLQLELPYVALAGIAGSGKTALAGRLSANLRAHLLLDPASDGGGPQHGDPSGHAYDHQIQFLVRRQPMLDKAGWPLDRALAVSDFYFDQSLAYARAELAPVDVDRFESAWQIAAESVVRPKLLVVCDVGQQTTRADGLADRIRGELLRLTARPGIGPTLIVRSGGSSDALDEVSAAILAMG